MRRKLWELFETFFFDESIYPKPSEIQKLLVSKIPWRNSIWDIFWGSNLSKMEGFRRGEFLFIYLFIFGNWKMHVKMKQDNH